MLHYSASDYWRQTAAWIDKEHRKRGFEMIGYHYFVRKSGLIELGRPLNFEGAHVRGQNFDSIGICYAGAGIPNPKQVDSLMGVLMPLLKAAYPGATFHGHRDFARTLCPDFDYSQFIEYWEDL